MKKRRTVCNVFLCLAVLFVLYVLLTEMNVSFRIVSVPKEVRLHRYSLGREFLNEDVYKDTDVATPSTRAVTKNVMLSKSETLDGSTEITRPQYPNMKKTYQQALTNRDKTNRAVPKKIIKKEQKKKVGKSATTQAKTKRPPVKVKKGIAKRPPVKVKKGIAKRPPVKVTKGIAKRPPVKVKKGIAKRPPVKVTKGIAKRPPVKVTKGNATEKKELPTTTPYQIQYLGATTFPLTLKGNYILNNPKICADISMVTALVVVHTAPSHFIRRDNIRLTYGSRAYFKDVRLVFLIGTVDNAILQDALVIEHKKYKDTVQGNFLDSYHNLTHKGVMGFRWITEHCSNVKYVIKIDDDAVFDMWRFHAMFSRINGARSIFCNVFYRARIGRKGKWKLDEGVFNGTQYWPFDYCPGFVVIMTGDVIKPLFKAAHSTPFLWIDDVYLYGHLPFKSGIKIDQFPKNFSVTPYENGGECLINEGKECQFGAVGLAYKESNFITFWNLIRKRNGVGLR